MGYGEPQDPRQEGRGEGHAGHGDAGRQIPYPCEREEEYVEAPPEVRAPRTDDGVACPREGGVEDGAPQIRSRVTQVVEGVGVGHARTE